VVLGFGAVGTAAYWTDQATLASTTFQTGTLDLKLDGNLPGQGGSYTKTSLGLTDMIPGESVAVTVAVSNAGTVGFKYTAKAYNTGGLSSGLRWTVVANSTASNSGSASAGNRTGTCGSGTTTASAVTLSTNSGSPTTVIGTARTLASTAAENVCIIGAVASSADNSLQGTSATGTLIVDAVQVAP
jgi:predicted ribosomally synthesized peptide with SipW-like signal peptide